MAELVYGLILAGGKSSRMGRDKALILWEGVPMLRRVGLCACTDRLFVLTPWPERYQNIVAPGWQFIQEHNPGGGPLAGLRQGLAYLSNLEPVASWVLVLACDLPCLDRQTLQAWRSKLQHLDRSCLALVPRAQNRWEPLCAFYRMECLISLEQSPARSFQEWLEQISIAKIDLDHTTQAMLKNCNSPEDLLKTSI